MFLGRYILVLHCGRKQLNTACIFANLNGIGLVDKKRLSRLYFSLIVLTSILTSSQPNTSHSWTYLRNNFHACLVRVENFTRTIELLRNLCRQNWSHVQNHNWYGPKIL